MYPILHISAKIKKKTSEGNMKKVIFKLLGAVVAIVVIFYLVLLITAWI